MGEVISYGSLFSGIGLLDLGVEMAFRDVGVPVRCAFQVELNPFCRAVLTKHWFEVPKHEDVTRVGSTGVALAPVDLLVGGFPCQDVSLAGKGRGLRGGERSWLWFEYLRVIKETRPRAVIIENVPGLVRRGLDDVITGLHGAGYEVEAARIRASDLGAPHRRERLFVLAYAHGVRESQPGGGEPEQRGRSFDGREARMAYAERGQLRQQPGRKRGSRGAGEALAGEARDAARSLADTDGAGLQGLGELRKRVAVTHGCGENDVADTASDGREGALRSNAGAASLQRAGRDVASGPQPGLGRMPDGRARWLDESRWPAPPGPSHEWEPSRTEGSVKNRPSRLKALGNAVVPQCAYVAARRVIQQLGLA